MGVLLTAIHKVSLVSILLSLDYIRKLPVVISRIVDNISDFLTSLSNTGNE